MMASIFFTERLPGISKFQSAVSFNVAAWRCLFDPSSGKWPETLTIVANCDDPEPASSRLPQKQGLCQVVNAPDFGMLSDF
jgi:hypothetical protein